MFTATPLRLAAAFAALALSLPAAAKAPACPAGQTSVKGACVAACTTEGRFSEPEGCECPAGFGKILTGDGAGECLPLSCGTGVTAGRDAKTCSCEAGFEKKSKGKGKAVCVAAKPKAKPKA